MIDLPVDHFQGRDHVELADQKEGEGRSLVLIHGNLSAATVTWVR
jgi:hypothetical protein